MPTIARLCPRLLLLDGGRLIEDGPAEHVIGRYLHGDLGTSARREWPDRGSAPGDDWARLRSARIVDAGGITSDVVDVAEPVGIEIAFDLLRREAVFPWIDLVDERGSHVFSAMDTNPVWSEPREAGRYVTTAWIPEHLLNEGTLHVTVSVKSALMGRKPWRHAEVESALTFQVVERDGPTARGNFSGRIGGPVRPLLRWTSGAAGAEEDAPLVARRRGD
jgi:lipopolysaccharide transport system ATP-binding protein